jgi:hypothetical protein
MDCGADPVQKKNLTTASTEPLYLSHLPYSIVTVLTALSWLCLLLFYANRSPLLGGCTWHSFEINQCFKHPVYLSMHPLYTGL